VQGGSCVQVSPARTLLLRDNSHVAFTMLIIAEISSVTAAARGSSRETHDMHKARARACARAWARAGVQARE
jgi:hypothetical protein